MSEKSETSKAPQEISSADVSRRDVLGQAARVVGAAAATAVTAESALARSADVEIDSAGRVIVKGTVVGRPEAAGVDGAVEKGQEFAAKAARQNIRNDWCINHRWWQSKVDERVRSGRGKKS